MPPLPPHLRPRSTRTQHDGHRLPDASRSTAVGHGGSVTVNNDFLFGDDTTPSRSVASSDMMVQSHSPSPRVESISPDQPSEQAPESDQPNHVCDQSLNEAESDIALVIRLADISDSEEIAAIYNYYILHSIRCTETATLTVDELAQRISGEMEEDDMPWVVACQKVQGCNRIVGFACASDYQSRKSMFAYTAEVEVYVTPECMQHQIGSSLMDRLLYLLDPFYNPLGGYQATDTGRLAIHGGRRVIDNVLMNVPFNKEDPEDLQSVVSFLDKFGFTKEAELADIGMKKGMHVSVALFRYTTGITVNPKDALT